MSTFLDYTDNGSKLVFGDKYLDHFFAFKVGSFELVLIFIQFKKKMFILGYASYYILFGYRKYSILFWRYTIRFT